MCTTFGLFSVIILFWIHLIGKLDTSKLFCVDCQTEASFGEYPCCVENIDEGAQPENFSNQINHYVELPCYTSSTSTSTVSPCSITTTPTSNRCPETGQHSIKQCALHRRLYPNPGRCYFDSDCLDPFNVCCFDSCYSKKICKTYEIIQATIN